MRDPAADDATNENDADDPVIPVFMPALVVILWNLEKRQGTPLTEAQVLELRDNAVCMTMPLSVARQLAESRGYDDLDPEDVWNEWQAARTQLLSEDDA